MKIAIAFAFFLAMANTAAAASFECQTFLNLDVISAQIITSEIKVKVPVDSTDVAVSYITEKANNFFTLEVFLPMSEMRIYGEGTADTAGQSISASVWTRDYMADVICRRLN